MRNFRETNLVFSQRHKRLSKNKITLGVCGHQWESNRKIEQDHIIHNCRKFKGHVSAHHCNCGRVNKGDGITRIGEAHEI